MTNYLSKEKQSRFDQLIALLRNGEMNEAQEAELLALRREMQNNKQERAARVATLKKEIADLGISVGELFSAAEIGAAQKPQAVAVKSAERKTRASDANEVLLSLPKEPGVKGPSVWDYRQGRVFERGSGTTPKPWPLKLRAFPTKLLALGSSAEALRPYFTPAGADYFATAEGQAELDKLVETVNEARSALL